MSLSEFEIIERFFTTGPGGGKGVVLGIGDDAAILEVPPGHQLLVATDTLVSGVHFFPDTEPFDAGYKSLAVNLSDMAAMAAEPLWYTLCLTLPENNPDWISEFARGIFSLAESCGAELVGGDLTHGPLSVTIQVMGSVPAGKGLTRAGAQPGHDIYVTGSLGMAALAVAVLSGEMIRPGGIPAECLEKLHRPRPRLETALAVRDLASAAIDISDGLAADLGHLLEAGGVGAEIELEKIPVFAKPEAMDHETAWQMALNGGDDYELCFTAATTHRKRISALGKSGPCPITRIGNITPGSEPRWLTAEGDRMEIPPRGYRHF